MIKRLASRIAAQKKSNPARLKAWVFGCPGMCHIEIVVRFWLVAWLSRWLAHVLGLPVLLGWVALQGKLAGCFAGVMAALAWTAFAF